MPAAAPARPWPFPRLLAHRGGGTLAPENTIAALDAGWRYGYRAAEVDAVLAADDVPVLLHDAGLERTSDGSGLVAQRTSQELAELDAGSWFGPAYAGTRIPSLLQALCHCRARGIWLNVEIKPVPGCEERTGSRVAQVVAEHCRAAGVAGAHMPLLSSFSHAALRSARAAAPELARGLLCEEIPSNWREAAQALDAFSLHCDHHHLTQAQAGAIRAAGFGLLCYTVNDPARALLLRNWGVDAICTDRVDQLTPG